MAGLTLLSLPIEIRDIIFQYVVACPQRVTFVPDELQRQYYSTATQPALTQVSRQLRSESLPIYYECNNFVLHTEAPKADDARRWLLCNASHLCQLRQISFWLRYVPRANSRTAGSGALGISLIRPTKLSAWTVDDDWKWVTVTRKPTELTEDAEFILRKLKQNMTQVCKETATPSDYMGLMMDLRMHYVQRKMM